MLSENFTFKALVEVCVDGMVAETIDNVGLEQQFTGTPGSLTEAVIFVATPCNPYPVQNLELLAVVKVYRGDHQVARVSARFSPEQHQSGPYDVFKDSATLMSQLDKEDTLYALSFYSRQWPRMWTHMRMEINMFALSSLLSA